MKRGDGAPSSGGKLPGCSPPEMSREERTMNRNHTQYLILTALFTALTAVGAFIRIPVGPTPITLQLLFIALAGVLLGPRWGALSQLLYVGMGLAGVPVFTGGGGFSYVFSPSFGYLIGFIFVPVIIGFITQRETRPGFLRIFLATMLGIFVCYCIGVPYMYIIMRNVMNVDISFARTVMIGFAVFIPGDIAKSLITGYLGKRLVPAVRRSTAGAGKEQRKQRAA